MKIQLIPDFKEAYKYATVLLGTIVTVLAGLEAYMPDMVAFLPPVWIPYATGAIVFARVIKFSMDTAKASVSPKC